MKKHPTYHFLLLLLPITVSANPINPFQMFLMVSELQIIDSTHWFIEIDLALERYDFNRDLRLQLPCSTDIFWIKAQPTDSTPPPSKIWVDTNRIGVINHQTFPSVKIKDKLVFGLNNFPCPKTGKETIGIDSTFSPQKSYCCFHFYRAHVGDPITIVEGYNHIFYMPCTVPSFGKKNTKAHMTGTLQGTIVGINQKPLNDVILNLYAFYNNEKNYLQIGNYSTDISGFFKIDSFISFPTSSIRFSKTSQVLRGVKVDPDSTKTLKICLDVLPEEIRQPIERQIKGNLAFLGVCRDKRNTVDFIVNCSGIGGQTLTMSIHSLKGASIASLKASAKGDGTYILHWNGFDSQNTPAAPGMYVCRIYSGVSKITKVFKL